jgi:hypothetical protein
LRTFIMQSGSKLEICNLLSNSVLLVLLKADLSSDCSCFTVIS